MPKLEPTNRKISLDSETAHITCTPGIILFVSEGFILPLILKILIAFILDGKINSWRAELSSHMAGITGLFAAAGGRLGQK